MARKRKQMTGQRLRRTVEKIESGIGTDGDDAEFRELVRRYNAHDTLVAACRRFVDTEGCDCEPDVDRKCPTCEGIAALANE